MSGSGTLPQIWREGVLFVFCQEHCPALMEQETSYSGDGNRADVSALLE
jgi:hypothetical protein